MGKKGGAMPPPYTLGNVQAYLNQSTMMGGHPYNHGGLHPTTNFQNNASLEEVFRSMINNSQAYNNLWSLPFPGAFRYEVTVSLVGLVDAAGNAYTCVTPQHPGGSALVAARLVIDVTAGRVWYVRTFVPYTALPAGMGGMAAYQLHGERHTPG
jgi:hypothetical protein